MTSTTSVLFTRHDSPAGYVTYKMDPSLNKVMVSSADLATWLPSAMDLQEFNENIRTNILVEVAA